MMTLLWHIAPVAVDMCYGLPDQEEADGSFFKQLKESLCSQTLALMGNFTHSCKDSTAGHIQSRRFLENIDSFLTKVDQERNQERCSVGPSA